MGKSQFSRDRNKKQCCLTDEGLRVLEKAIAAQGETDSGIERSGRLNRGTVRKIRSQTEPATWGSIEKVFGALNLDLGEEHWQEWQCGTGVERSRKPDKRQPKQSERLQVATRAEQIADLLWTLNYDAQEGDFKSRCKLPHSSHLFVVQAPDYRIQKWLVKRLIRQYHDVQPYPLNVRSHPMRSDFCELWKEFAERLELSEDSPEFVLQGLCDLARTKPVFIAVFGLHRFQETRDKFLKEFWMELSQRFCDQTTRSVKSKLVLFLIEEPQPNLFESVQDVCFLSPLTEISEIDVTAWIQLEKVYEFLSQTIGEDTLEQLVASDLPNWQTHPVQVIDDVCYAFKLDKGIAEIESYWELAG